MVLSEELCLNKNEEGRQGYRSSDRAWKVVPLLVNKVRKQFGLQMAFPDSAHSWHPADEGQRGSRKIIQSRGSRSGQYSEGQHQRLLLASGARPAVGRRGPASVGYRSHALQHYGPFEEASPHTLDHPLVGHCSGQCRRRWFRFSCTFQHMPERMERSRQWLTASNGARTSSKTRATGR